MRTFKVIYIGNSTRFKNFEEEVIANTARDAIEKVYAERLDSNYFPQDDGTILDCSGELIAYASGEAISYDGGIFTTQE